MASLEESVASGDLVESLRALRDHLARTLDAGQGNAATAKELREVLKQLAEMKPVEASRADEIKERRRKRLGQAEAV